MRRSRALLLLLLWTASTPVLAQDGGAATATTSVGERALAPELTPRVKSSTSPDVVPVGGLVKLTIEAEGPSSVTVSLPEQPFGGLELQDRRLHSEPIDDRTRTVFELDLLALEPGTVELPPLLLRYVGPNGELGSLRTAPTRVVVNSLLANEPNAEPKPATKPVRVMRDDYTLLWIAGGLLSIALIAGATLLVSRWLRRRPKPVAPAPPPRPAWELAYERLHALQRQKDALFAEQRGELFIDGVSDAIREYLGKRYGFDGLEQTTGELLTRLEQLRPQKLSLSGVSLLLEQCDLVKFARAKPDQDEAQDLLNGALGIVRATTPVLSNPPPATQTGSAR